MLLIIINTVDLISTADFDTAAEFDMVHYVISA
jgi:hypothetical protein